MKHRPFDTFFHWMTLSALFAVALSQFRLVNDLRAIHASGPEFHAQMPSDEETTYNNRVKDVLEEQARINRQMLQVLQTIKPHVPSENVLSIESAPMHEEPEEQPQLQEPDLTMENGPFDRSGFENQTDDDIVAMNREILRERLLRFEASLTDADREELDRRLQVQIDQLALQISDQPQPEEIALLETLTEKTARLTPAEREWRDQTMQSLRQGTLMEMYSEHSLFQELQAVDLMQLQVGEF